MYAVSYTTAATATTTTTTITTTAISNLAPTGPVTISNNITIYTNIHIHTYTLRTGPPSAEGGVLTFQEGFQASASTPPDRVQAGTPHNHNWDLGSFLLPTRKIRTITVVLSGTARSCVCIFAYNGPDKRSEQQIRTMTRGEIAILDQTSQCPGQLRPSARAREMIMAGATQLIPRSYWNTLANKHMGKTPRAKSPSSASSETLEPSDRNQTPPPDDFTHARTQKLTFNRGGVGAEARGAKPSRYLDLHGHDADDFERDLPSRFESLSPLSLLLSEYTRNVTDLKSASGERGVHTRKEHDVQGTHEASGGIQNMRGVEVNEGETRREGKREIINTLCAFDDVNRV
ncbi:hypothetical protein B0F90DRAFT_1668208 [Multifurca ochricompacta]|uniref:Uncharacterized protein n=1 Tax=Multifurca ochricompacta TaxID=376703 RepID=A0AAD4QNH6_9AGAM|nr:hypothetical protein B0F90DRAFT_1668208 [Multifurca ochricompacta]